MVKYEFNKFALQVSSVIRLLLSNSVGILAVCLLPKQDLISFQYVLGLLEFVRMSCESLSKWACLACLKVSLASLRLFMYCWMCSGFPV